MGASVKRISLLIALTLVGVPAVAACAASPASGPAARSAGESSAGQGGDLSSVTFYVPTVT